MAEAVSGVIMAGGGSRRMGRDKALIPIDGEPLIARVERQLAAFVDELLISVGDDSARLAFLGRPLVVDREPDQGPLGALASVFERASHPRLLVVSCDIPELPAALVRALLDATTNDTVDAALAVDADGRRQPLVACYRQSARAAVERALVGGKRRMDALLGELRVREIATSERLWNLNSPADLEAYLGRQPR